MLRLQRISLTAIAVLALALFVGPAVSSADDGAAVTIHEGGDATSWGYTPTTTTIQAGQTVTWTNSGDMAHDANSTDGSWQVPLLNKGQAASYTFANPGTYTYICTPHPWMLGTIVVTAAVAPTAVPSDAGSPPVDDSQPLPTDPSGG